MCIRPAGAAAAASTAGIGAVSHSRHVLLVIFVLFNKKTIKSRHIYNGGTTAQVGGIVRPARRARQNNRIIIFPCRYIIIVEPANERARRTDTALNRDRRPSEKERRMRRSTTTTTTTIIIIMRIIGCAAAGTPADDTGIESVNAR